MSVAIYPAECQIALSRKMMESTPNLYLSSFNSSVHNGVFLLEIFRVICWITSLALRPRSWTMYRNAREFW